MTKRIEITAQVKVPVEATDEEIREWVMFELQCSSIKTANKLSNYDLEAYGYINIRTVA